VSAPAVPPRLLGPLARFTTAAVGVTGPAEVRERLERAGAGELPDDLVDALGRDLDLLAVQLAGSR
jgi:hypothetical protein